MRGRLTSGRSATLLAVLLLAVPAIAAPTIIAPQPRPADADLARRDYFAVAAGSSDATVGDLVVTTTVECGAAGCQRDVWFRFLHAPSRVPTVEQLLDDLSAGLDACLEALLAQGCADPALATTFQDLPVSASDALDETAAMTDGRTVVFAAGAPGAPKDVYRFDARRPDVAPVLVAGDAADEMPFGVGGDWVGVRRVRDDGKHELSAVNWRTGTVRALAVVNATDPAALSPTRAAWATGATLSWQVLLRASPLTRYTHEERSIRSLHLWNERLVWIEAKECPAGASDCNHLVTPPRKAEVRAIVFQNYTRLISDADDPAQKPNYYGALYVPYTVAPVTTTSRACASTGVTDPVAAQIFHDVVFVRTNSVPCAGGATKESIVLYEKTAKVASAPTSWSNRAPGQLGTPAASNRYIYVLDYDGGETSLDAYPWVHCYAALHPNGGGGSTACVGAGPASPGGPLGTPGGT